MKTRFKKMMALLLSSAMIAGSTPAASFASTNENEVLKIVPEETSAETDAAADNPSDQNGKSETEAPLAGAIEEFRLGETKTVRLNAGEHKTFSFTPTENRKYVISFDAETEIWAGVSFKKTMSEYDDFIAEVCESNIFIDEVQKNTTYYIHVQEMDDTDNVSLSMSLTAVPVITLDGNGGRLADGRDKYSFSTDLVEDSWDTTWRNPNLEEILEVFNYNEDGGFTRDGYWMTGWSKTQDGAPIDIDDLYEIIPEDGDTIYVCWQSNLMTLGEPVRVCLKSEETKTLFFTPEESGEYVFCSKNDDYEKIEAKVYTPEGAEEGLVMVSDYGQFIMSCTLEGNKTYELVTNYISDFSSGQYDITVIRKGDSVITLNGNGGKGSSGEDSREIFFIPGSSLGNITYNILNEGDDKLFQKEGFVLFGLSEEADGDMLQNLYEVYPNNGQTYYAVWREATKEIVLDETTHLESSFWYHQYGFFRIGEKQDGIFVPEEDGYYLFSWTDGTMQSYIRVFDADGESVGYDGYGGPGMEIRPFRLFCDLKAGQTYRVVIDDYYELKWDFTDFVVTKFTGEPFQLTMEGDGGVTESGETTQNIQLFEETSLSELLRKSKSFVRQGYTFIGWSTEANGELIDNYYSFVLSGAQTLFACWEEIETISPGVAKHVEINSGKVKQYFFVPENDGSYIIYSANCTSGDPYVTVYDSPDFNNYLWIDDDGGEGRNFSVLCNLEAGTTYGIKADSYSDAVYDLFVIEKPVQIAATLKVSNISTKVNVSKARSTTLKVSYTGDGKLTFASSNSKIKVSATGRVTIPKSFVGSTIITVKAAETDRFEAAEAKAKITVKRLANTITANRVTKASAAKAQSFKLSVKQKGTGKLTYKSSSPSVKVTAAGNVTIAKNFSGRATITIKAAAAGAYAAASKNIVITVKPAAVTVGTSKNVAEKKISLTWKKSSGAEGYQIQYSTSKDFKKSKSVTIKSASTVKRSLTKLVKGKTYYIRIRAYKNDTDGKLYSAWRSFKAAKVTK